MMGNRTEVFTSDSEGLSVVVLNWNLKDETIACVESLLRQDALGFRILVVDNGSTDGSVEAFKQRWQEEVAVLRSPTNLGFAGGMNLGIREALRQGSDWVLLLNNDTVADPSLVSSVLGTVASRPKVGIVSPAIYYYDAPDRIWRLGDRQYTWLPIPLRVRSGRVRREAFIEVDYVPGCAMFVRRDVFELIGLLDEGLFLYYEDADFCRRATEAGYGIGCVASARLWHKVSMSAKSVPPSSRYHLMRGKVLFMRRYAHGPSSVLTDLYLMMDLMWKMMKGFAVGNWALVAATYKGFREGWFTSLERAV